MDLKMKVGDPKIEKEIEIINQMSNLDYLLILNLQEGFAGVAALEAKKMKTRILWEEKNMGRQMLNTFFEDIKVGLQKKERIQNWFV